MADYFEEARQTDTTMTATTADTTTETTALAAPSTEGPTIMAYPPGVSLATITIGAGRTMFGAAPKLISATVTPIFVGTPHVVHAASGWAFYPSPQTFRVENGEELTFELPHVNAEGWRDTAGNEFPALLASGERDRGWAYHAKFTVIGGSGQDAIPHRYEKVFQPLVGQTEPLDIDLVPDGQIGAPVSAPVAVVTSVNGQTGPINLDGVYLTAEDGAALADAAGDQAVIDSGTYTDETVGQARSDLTPSNGARPVGRGELLFNVRDHGVKGDGVTDDTVAIQALIDAGTAAGGRTLFFPAGSYRITNLVLKQAVILMGTQPAYGYGPSFKGSTRFHAISGATGIMIDSIGGNSGVVGIDVFGNANATGTTGVTTGIRSSGTWCRFSEIHFNNFRGPALQIVSGNAVVVDNILAINSCLDRTATSDVGVMDIAGNDHFVTRVEASASLTTGVSSTSLFINAFVIRSTNGFYSNCVGEFADRGYLITGSKNRLTGMRADRNFGIGYENRGGANAFAACGAVDNSRGLNDVYPAFRTSGSGNTYAGCIVSYLSNELPTYAFEDTVNNSSAGARNTYAGCTGHAARQMYSGIDYLGSSFQVPNHPVRVSTGATIPVDKSGFQVLVYTAAETVTNFTGGHSGQTITVLALTANTTLAHSSTLKLKAKANTTLVADTAYRFTRYNGVWYEI